jgi:hypothetical protein
MLLLLQRAAGGDDEDGHARRSYIGAGRMRTRASRRAGMGGGDGWSVRVRVPRPFMSAFCAPRQIIHCHFPSLLEQHAFFYVFLLCHLVRAVECFRYFFLGKRKREMLYSMSEVFLRAAG